MNRHFLEFWGKALLEAAKSQKQMEDLAKWFQGGFGGFPDYTQLFKSSYGLDEVAEDGPDFFSLWKKAEEDFRNSFKDYLGLLGVVPREEYDALTQENDKLKASILETIDMESDPVVAMKEMLRLNMGMKSNPILCEYYNRDVFEKLKQSHLEDKAHDHMSFMYDNFYEAVKEQQRKGKIRTDIDCNMIMAMFAALANIDTHKDEIGFEYFPELVHYMSEFVMKGLTEIPAKE